MAGYKTLIVIHLKYSVTSLVSLLTVLSHLEFEFFLEPIKVPHTNAEFPHTLSYNATVFQNFGLCCVFSLL